MNFVVRDWMSKNEILLMPKRRDDETDEEFQKRCAVIKNIGEGDEHGTRPEEPQESEGS